MTAVDGSSRYQRDEHQLHVETEDISQQSLLIKQEGLIQLQSEDKS